MRRGFATGELYVVVAIFFILAAILLPVFSRARENARRSACQSNLKHISVALGQYAADNNGISPRSNWVGALQPYMKENRVFRCPSSKKPQRASDYFFNARFLEKKLGDISSPQTLILWGDGDGESPLNQLPVSWLKDEYSPAWRHLGKANYLFADGHIKPLKVERINRDFRMVPR